MKFVIILVVALGCVVVTTAQQGSSTDFTYSPTDASTTEPAASSTSEATTDRPDDLNADCVLRINAFRRLHTGVQTVEYDPSLVQYAQVCADYYADNNPNLDHRQLGTLNNVPECEIGVASRAEHFGLTDANQFFPEDEANTALLRWYEQRNTGREANTLIKYNYTNPDLTTLDTYKDFTQMFWEGSTRIACALSRNRTGGNTTRVLSVMFSPPGNSVVGGSPALYIENVKPPRASLGVVSSLLDLLRGFF